MDKEKIYNESYEKVILGMKKAFIENQEYNNGNGMKILISLVNEWKMFKENPNRLLGLSDERFINDFLCYINH